MGTRKHEAIPPSTPPHREGDGDVGKRIYKLVRLRQNVSNHIPKAYSLGLQLFPPANAWEVWSTLATIICFCLILYCKLPPELIRLKRQTLIMSRFLWTRNLEPLSWVFKLQNLLRVVDKMSAGAEIIWWLYRSCDICFQDSHSHGCWQGASVPLWLLAGQCSFLPHGLLFRAAWAYSQTGSCLFPPKRVMNTRLSV